MTKEDTMRLDFTGNDYLAQILQLDDGFMLTIRQKRGPWFKRRRFHTVGEAQDEMWRYDSRWKVS
jgi:hypothetical protein